MKINLSSVVFFSLLSTLIRLNWARNLKSAAPNHFLRKHAADVKASSRQDISYNLDLINRNGSSALMYSQRKLLCVHTGYKISLDKDDLFWFVHL